MTDSTGLNAEEIEHLDYTPRALKGGAAVFWVRRKAATDSAPEEIEACLYPAPERGYWYRYYERVDDEIPRIELWHYGDKSPIKCISSATREYPEFRSLSREVLCALAGIFASEQIDAESLSQMKEDDRALLVRRATTWAKKIDWLS
jgi:hypothetical protein